MWRKRPDPFPSGCGRGVVWARDYAGSDLICMAAGLQIQLTLIILFTWTMCYIQYWVPVMSLLIPSSLSSLM